MSEFSLASTAKKKTQYHLSSLLLSDFMLFCSFILSHPLYFSYLIFFSPYLLKIFSFLSPLFVTTTLLLLAFLTLTPTPRPSFVNQQGSVCHLELPESSSKVSFLLTTYQTLVETLRSKVEDQSDGFVCLEELEAYKMVFETEMSPTDEVLEMESNEDSLEAVEAPLENNLDEEKPTEIARPEANNQVRAVVKLFEDFLQEKEGVENLSSKRREKEVKSLISLESNKGDEEQEEEEEFMSGSKAAAMLGNSNNKKISEVPKVSADNGKGEDAVNFQRVIANWSGENINIDEHNYNSKVVTDKDQTMEWNSPLGNFGSMRKKRVEKNIGMQAF
ncbi:hypothetical protein CCACVL1_21080 [Corchorus capsularis]|uniref:Uncharacterized protein n=1 Tax=Corchorus capsularis TaxID=210143 RepID=A0A1R3H8B5_COCAP|nr:hypothetical protein CCACVL1_21080 [Corchorus capsularis]